MITNPQQNSLTPRLSPITVKTLTQVIPLSLIVALITGYLGLESAAADYVRLLIAIAVFASAFVCLFVAPRVALIGIFGYLAILGGLRRGLIPLLGWPPQDVLLLVMPFVAALFCLYLIAVRRVKINSSISRLLLVLLCFMLVEIVNPLQGGIAVGLAGALFYVVPLLWYFLGRVVCDRIALDRLFKAVIVIAVIAAVYGLFQTFFGFTEADKEWMKIDGYAALGVGATLRAIAFFTSAEEYESIVCLGIILLWAAFLLGKRLTIVPIMFLAVAGFLESQRSLMFATIIAMTILWAIQAHNRRTWVARGVVALALATIGLVSSMTGLQYVQMSSSISELVKHQVVGVLNPTDPSASTATLHTFMVAQGILSGFTTPYGQGLGGTTIASAKLSGSGGGTEFDISNMFVSLGAVGGFLYLFIIGVVLNASIRCWIAERSLLSLSIIGVLLIGFGQWLNGGQYSFAFLIWIVIGALDQMTQRRWASNERRLENIKVNKPLAQSLT